MKPVDLLILAIIGLILAGAVIFVWRARKKGTKCLGCPDSCACSQSNCSGGCNGCQKSE